VQNVHFKYITHHYNCSIGKYKQLAITTKIFAHFVVVITDFHCVNYSSHLYSLSLIVFEELFILINKYMKFMCTMELICIYFINIYSFIKLYYNLLLLSEVYWPTMLLFYNTGCQCPNSKIKIDLYTNLSINFFISKELKKYIYNYINIYIIIILLHSVALGFPFGTATK